MIGIERRWRLPLATLAAALALLLALMAETVSSMVAVWISATTYNHCFLVLPISLFLIWQRRAGLARLTPVQAWWALIPLALFAGLWLIGRAGQIMLFQHVAMVGMMISIILAVLGREVGRMIAFPLAFLGFMVPFGDFLVPFLQQFTADFSVTMLRLINIPVFRDGIMIETPSGLFEVAEACAGIRFLIANIMVATLFAYCAFERRWKWTAFLALSVILPIVANGFRAAGIILIAYLTDNEYAAGIDHLVYGWGFFAAIMLLFLAIGGWMADWPDRPIETSPAGNTAHVGPWRPALAMPLVTLIASGPLYALAVLDRVPAPIWFDTSLTLNLGPACKTDDAVESHWRPRFQHADFTKGVRLDCGAQPVDLFLAYYAYERQGAELIHYANRLSDGERWTRISAAWYAPNVDGLPAKVIKEELFGRQAEDRLVLAWYWIGGRLIAKDWQAKLYQLYRKLLGRDVPVALIALSAPYDDRPEDALPSIAEVLRHHKGITTYLADLAIKK